MKPGPIRKKQNRVIVTYILGIVIPGIILGLFAIRGLQNDRALLEKQNRQELRLLTHDIFSRLDQKVDSIKVLLSTDPQSIKDLSQIYWRFLPEDKPKVINGDFLYLPDGSLEIEAGKKASRELKTAEKFEFIDGDFEKAIVSYKQIIRNSPDKKTEIKALFGKARVSYKLGEYDVSMKTYQTLAENYSEHQLSTHLPVQAMALLEMLKMKSEGVENRSDLKISQGLFNFFMEPPVKIEKTSYEFLFAKWESLEGQLPGEFRKNIESKRQLTEHLHLIIDMSPSLFSSHQDYNRFIDSEKYAGLFIQTIGEDEFKSGCVLKLDTLLNIFIPEIIKDLNPKEIYYWKLHKSYPLRENELNSASDNVGASFPPGYPPWVLEVRIEENKVNGNLFDTSRGALIMVFIFILLVMISGLLFIFYTLNQEMKLSTMKSEFISNVSHEFKTPLTSLRHMTEIMHLKRISSEERKDEYLKAMLKQCDNLGHLIENILDFSKIEVNSENYNFKKNSLEEILDDVLHVFKNRTASSNIELETSIEADLPQIPIDRDSIQQVLLNLLDNAFKYSGEEKKIRCAIYKNDEKELTIEVQDWGFGINEKDKVRLFDRFFRGDKLKTAGIKGSGIGLTIVKKIVDAHKGRIVLNSELNKGSTFKVILPTNT